jgi:hypothetical protein
MCERDSCGCGIPTKTINDIAKELAELTPPQELEKTTTTTTTTKRGNSNVHSTNARWR